MSLKSKLSVVIACYNHEQYLKECIESIWQLHPTDSEIELLVVDDNSTDSSWSMLQKLKLLSPIAMIIEQNKNNSGAAASFSRGVELSSGDFLTFFASDDLFCNDAFNSQLQNLRAHPEMEVCFANGVTFGDGVSPSDVQTPFAVDLLKKSPQEVFHYITCNVNVIYNQAAVIRKSYFEKIGGFDLKVRNIEDWPLTIKLFQGLTDKQQFGFVNEPQWAYRQLSTSQSRNYEKHFDDIIELFRNYSPKNEVNNTVHKFCLDRASYCIRYLPKKSPKLMIKYLIQSQQAQWSSQSLKDFWNNHLPDFRTYLRETFTGA